ncbi:MAG: 50S ribosomal protein L24 [Candidatus Taylorbacteria bacterium]|nr:50S ribosomal protein L24 [Candidatus Taylorbacteria bacterium]
MHIKKGDLVVILSGDDKGKTAKVVRALPALGKVLVEGVNIVKKHERARREGQKGQMVDRAMPIFASKVRLAGDETKKAEVKKEVKKAETKATKK